VLLVVVVVVLLTRPEPMSSNEAVTMALNSAILSA
jgi:hypothetical protein